MFLWCGGLTTLVHLIQIYVQAFFDIERTVGKLLESLGVVFLELLQNSRSRGHRKPLGVYPKTVSILYYVQLRPIYLDKPHLTAQFTRKKKIAFVRLNQFPYFKTYC